MFATTTTGTAPSRLARMTVAAVALALTLVSAPMPIGAQAGEHWVSTWGTALVERRDAPPRAARALQGWQPIAVRNPNVHFSDQTLRQVVRTSIGGERIRVVLSNAFGTAPLEVEATRLALRRDGASIEPASVRTLTFGGHATTTVLAGAVAVSDPVDLYLPGDTAAGMSPVTTHGRSLHTNYVSPTGDHTGVEDMPVMTMTESWFFLARVEVVAPDDTGLTVTIGDSITDGYGATIDTNNSWPDHLARRFQESNRAMAVVNVGIGGNRVLRTGPA